MRVSNVCSRVSDLGHLAALIEANGRARTAPSTKRLLFSATGFDPALRTAAASRDDVDLIDLQRLYHSA